MKKYKPQLILIGCGTHKFMNQPINQYGIHFQVQNRREMRSCHFIPNKVLYAVIFYDTQFY